MKDRKNVIWHLLSFVILAVGFVLCRYVLFSVHGMREWPVYLFAVGVTVLLFSFFARVKVLPFVTALGYTVAFAMGALFQKDGTDPGGGTTNNLWIIWTLVFLCAVIFTAAAEWLLCRRKK